MGGFGGAGAAPQKAAAVDLLADVFSAPAQPAQGGGGFDAFGAFGAGNGTSGSGLGMQQGTGAQSPGKDLMSSLVNLDSMSLNGGAQGQSATGHRPSMNAMAMGGRGNTLPVGGMGGGMRGGGGMGMGMGGALGTSMCTGIGSMQQQNMSNNMMQQGMRMGGNMGHAFSKSSLDCGFI